MKRGMDPCTVAPLFRGAEGPSCTKLSYVYLLGDQVFTEDDVLFKDSAVHRGDWIQAHPFLDDALHIFHVFQVGARDILLALQHVRDFVVELLLSLPVVGQQIRDETETVGCLQTETETGLMK